MKSYHKFNDESWRKVFVDATSRCQCAFQALFVGLMDEDGFFDPVIFSSCIFLENDTSQTIFDTILDKVIIFLMFVFNFRTQILPSSFLSLIPSFKLKANSLQDCLKRSRDHVAYKHSDCHDLLVLITPIDGIYPQKNLFHSVCTKETCHAATLVHTIDVENFGDGVLHKDCHNHM